MRTRVGYAGGTTADPTYHSLGDHTESVEVDYDPAALSYDDLLGVFWAAHDPRGSEASRQYRSAILYRTDEERSAAEASRSAIERSIGPVSTAIEPLTRFYRAEDYHQKYRLRGRRELADEFSIMYPHDSDFVDSTAAARVNGWLAGYGELKDVEAEAPLTGLSSEAQAGLIARFARPHGLLSFLR